MKKFILIVLLLFFITGCSNINKMDNDDLINLSLKNNNIKTNTAFEGYKIYIPNNMNILNDNSNNTILYSSSDKYYLYVDVISYYNDTSNVYKINEEQDAFYSKILNYDDKDGYVLVTKYKNKYFVEVMYNYGKIEVITNNYKTAISNSLIVLKSITYNDKIIDSLIGKNVLEYDEEKFNLLGPSNGTNDLLEWVYEDVDNELNDLDEDIIKIDEEQ